MSNNDIESDSGAASLQLDHDDRLRIREVLEGRAQYMVGGDLDDVSVGRIYAHEQCKFHIIDQYKIFPGCFKLYQLAQELICYLLCVVLIMGSSYVSDASDAPSPNTRIPRINPLIDLMGTSNILLF